MKDKNMRISGKIKEGFSLAKIIGWEENKHCILQTTGVSLVSVGTIVVIILSVVF